MNRKIGHSKEDGNQCLNEHLLNVGLRMLASNPKMRKTAFLTGLAHDLGKFSEEAQRRMRGEGSKVDHSTASAQFIHEAEGCESIKLLIAWSVACHHTGLLNLGSNVDGSGAGTLFSRLHKTDIPVWKRFSDPLLLEAAYNLLTEAEQEYAEFLNEDVKNESSQHEDYREQFLVLMLLRHLHSSLVDADRLDTERFMCGNIRDFDSLTVHDIRERVNNKIENYRHATEGINRYRSEILNQCLAKSSLPKGLFRLSAPTGSGKTLSSLGFAVNHAAFHKMRRILYVIPYNTITDQIAEEFRTIIDPKQTGSVVEHYSNYNYEENDEDFNKRHDQLIENWDAPFIITSVVQFFESLFAAKNSKLQKVHNIAGSMIVFDEAQLFPSAYLSLILMALKVLVTHFDCTVVLMSATNPPFEAVIPEFTAVELLDNPEHYREVFKKVEFLNLGTLSKERLIEDITSHHNALCIVNRKATAAEIYQDLIDSGTAQEDVFHLSTNLCQKDRIKILERIRRRLKAGKRCIVVSTSLVEAGVDLDFSAVYRELTGIDSIVQAAGRCNREGKLTDETGASIYGRAYTFELKDVQTPRYLASRAKEAKFLLRNKKFSNPLSAETEMKYFSRILKKTSKKTEDIVEMIKKYEAENIGRAFKIISSPTKSILIPKEEALSVLEAYKNEPSVKLLRKLQPYTVEIYSSDFDRAAYVFDKVESGNVEFYILNNLDYYDENIGLKLDSEIEYVI